MELTPTLWRTCRALSGATRLELLRRIIEEPDQCVTGLSRAAGLSEPRASQELRRLQSRGLVQALREGCNVKYRPVPDPKVPSAKGLLGAMKTALARNSPEADAQTIRLAKAFSHQRRLDIVGVLLNGPGTAVELQAATRIPEMALFRHMRLLKEGGVVRRSRQGWELAPNPHPLAKCLVGRLKNA